MAIGVAAAMEQEQATTRTAAVASGSRLMRASTPRSPATMGKNQAENLSAMRCTSARCASASSTIRITAAEGRVGAERVVRCADDPPGDGRGVDLRARSGLDGHGLAGDRRLIDGGLTAHHLAVHRDLLARAHIDQVAGLHLRDGSSISAPSAQPRILGRQRCQVFDHTTRRSVVKRSTQSPTRMKKTTTDDRRPLATAEPPRSRRGSSGCAR